MKIGFLRRGVLHTRLLPALGVILLVCVPALAGGGPENVFVVVNADSWASLAVANEFVHLRRIPPTNVVYLNGGRSWSFGSVDVKVFRDRILKPVMRAIEKRHLSRQIDYIVYSSDFPYRVGVSKDMAGKKFTKPITRIASINGLTYLFRWVTAEQAGDPAKRLMGYLSLRSNFYYRRVARLGSGPADRSAQLVVHPPIGFSSRYGWTPAGHIATGRTGPRQGYVLSTVLAVTSGRGTSVNEAIRCLRRSAAADGTRPGGTVYYMVNSNVRSRVRQWGFETAVAGLKRLGVKAEAVKGVVPQKRPDVMGVMAGSARFNWPKSGSTILPGAICEHLTSYGGIMDQFAGHTSCTEFIRHGASGTCGAVSEPFAVQAKFPTPMLHYFYASGCSLAEAFYQSISGPYQLLIIGDPLCRPWAKIPTVTLAGVEEGRTVKGQVVLTPGVKETGISIRRYDLFIDGLRRAAQPPGKPFKLDTAKLADGWHELRVVAVTADAVATQGRRVVGIVVNNHGRKLDVVGPKGGKVVLGRCASLSVNSPGAKRIAVFHNSRELGVVEGARGDVKIDTRRLGLGTVRLQAIGTIEADGKTASVAAAPIELTVEPPPPLPAVRTPKGKTFVKGLKFIFVGGRTVVIKDLANKKDRALITAGLKQNQTFELEGYFDVPKDGVYQFQFNFDGPLTIMVDGKPLATPVTGRWKFLPVSLGKGAHLFRAKGTASKNLRIDIRFGGPGALSLSEKRFAFRHVGKPPTATSQSTNSK